MLNEQVTKELELELCRLEQRGRALYDELEAINKRIEAIKVLIASDLDDGQSDGVDNEKSGYLTSDEIHEALEALGPSKPRDVTEYLERKGLKDDMETPLSVRVANLMWRLAKNGMIAKGKGGVYSPFPFSGRP